ncbi:MAG: fumarylacetoacetate hydrolase family protein [Methanomassiliicoccales archaeon]|nr:fumarylacetoacetate hydrolase family protein [Methanomassiliicoccales archaeon]
MLCRKIVCVGRNYHGHIAEMKSEDPMEPVLFLKPPSSLIGDGDSILLPRGIGRIDHEAELAVIIGNRGKNVPVEDALDCIAQVAVFNDVTARDLQATAKKKGLPWTISKGIDTFSPISDSCPVENVEDLQDLDIELRVNGVIRQRGSTSEMIFSVAELVAYISRWMKLEEGDIIATGTPEGVGPIQPGDLIEVVIPKVGRLANPVQSL